MSHFGIETQCRSCRSKDLEVVLKLGSTPLADRLVDESSLEDEELTAPLTLAFCGSCSLVQILETVEPEVLFGGDYPYFSSVSESLMQHFRDSALSLIAARRLDQRSLVVEAASNDGYMLRNFVKQNIPVLGIDPARDPVISARKQGIPTLHTFFNKELAQQLRQLHPKGVDLFLANNVLAHVPDLNGFVEGIHTLLKPGGIAVMEVHYLADLVDNIEFDTIYHQHLCYFSVTTIDKLFRRHGLFLNEVQHTGIHGGSLRLMIGLDEDVQDSVKRMLRAEKEKGVNQLEYYNDFAVRVSGIKSKLLEQLKKLKAQGKSIAGYGAAAKAATLMAYTGIDESLLEFVVDKNDYKHGRFMGGNHLPILPPSALAEKNPDFVLILAWNFAEEIISENEEFVSNGGRFLIPIPEPGLV